MLFSAAAVVCLEWMSIQTRMHLRSRTLLCAFFLAALLSPAAAGNYTQDVRDASAPLQGVDAASSIVTWPLKAADSPAGIVMAGASLSNNDLLARATGDNGALDQWKGTAKKAAKAAVDEAMEEIMEDDPDSVLSLGTKSSTYKELQEIVAKARAITIKVPRIGAGGAASATANSKAAAEAEAAAFMASNEAAVTEAYDMPAPPDAAEDAPFVRTQPRVGLFKTQQRAVPGKFSQERFVARSRVRAPMIKALASIHTIKGPSLDARVRRDVKSREDMAGGKSAHM